MVFPPFRCPTSSISPHLPSRHIVMHWNVSCCLYCHISRVPMVMMSPITCLCSWTPLCLRHAPKPTLLNHTHLCYWHCFACPRTLFNRPHTCSHSVIRNNHLPCCCTALCTPWPSKLPNLPLRVETRNYVLPGNSLYHSGARRVRLKVKNKHS